MEMMQTAGIPAGVVATGEDLMEHDPQLQARSFFEMLGHPEMGQYRANSGAHFRLSKYDYPLTRAPLLGEHNEYVFKEILGLSGEEFERLVGEKVIY